MSDCDSLWSSIQFSEVPVHYEQRMHDTLSVTHECSLRKLSRVAVRQLDHTSILHPLPVGCRAERLTGEQEVLVLTADGTKKRVR
jgi:hypothetical protein